MSRIGSLEHPDRLRTTDAPKRAHEIRREHLQDLRETGEDETALELKARQTPASLVFQPKRDRSRSLWRTRLTSTRKSLAASAAERLSSSRAMYCAWLRMRGSLSAPTTTSPLNAPTPRKASSSVVGSSAALWRPEGGVVAVVRGRLRASAALAAAYHLASERFSASLPPGS